jgi:hypothetical protein
MHLSLALLLFSLAGIPASAKPSRVRTPLVLYDFQRSDCLSGLIKDSITSRYRGGDLLGGIIVDGSTSQMCISGNGLTNTESSPTLESRAVSRSFTGKLAAATPTLASTVEMWVKWKATTDGKNHVIMAVANNATRVGAMFVSELGGGLYVNYRAGSQTPQLNVHQLSAKPVPNTALHIAITTSLFSVTVASVRVQVYINGTLVRSGTTGGNRNGFWFTNQRLYLFSLPPPGAWSVTSLTPAPWEGTMYQLALYNKTLTAAEIQQNFLAKVPNSVPVAANATVVVGQNGEVGTHYDTPAFYLSPVPVLELANISLPASDLDEDRGHPNYNKSNPAMAVYIASLPARGTLYQLNGSVIASVPVLVDPYSSHTVRFRPRWNELSWPAVYTSFTYYAVDGVTRVASNPATITVVVKAAKRPPTPQDQNVTARARQLVKIAINGTAQGGYSLSRAWIVGAPMHGQLYQVFPNGSVAVAHGAMDVAVGSSGLWSFEVAYRYTGPEDRNVSATGQVADDSFTFAVADNRNLSSVIGEANITVLTALVAIPSQARADAAAYTALEARPSPIRLFGKDSDSMQPRQLCFQITSLPRQGVLRDASSGALIKAGTTLSTHASSPYAAGVTVTYQSRAGFFTIPRADWEGRAFNSTNDTFRFLVEVCGQQGIVSLEVEQRVAVLNVNDPTGLRLPASHYSVYAVGDISAATAPGGVSQYLDHVVLRSVMVTDPDRGVDPVVVRINAVHGIIRLNLSSLDLADFTSMTYCHAAAASWSCQGSGEDGSMTFVASPWMVERLLEGAQYFCTKTGVRDLVRITVSDGHGGQCLPEGVFTSRSNRSSCLETHGNFTVQVGESAIIASFQDERSKFRMPRVLKLAILILLCTAVLALLTWAVRRCRQHRANKVQTQQRVIRVLPRQDEPDPPPSPEAAPGRVAQENPLLQGATGYSHSQEAPPSPSEIVSGKRGRRRQRGRGAVGAPADRWRREGTARKAPGNEALEVAAGDGSYLDIPDLHFGERDGDSRAVQFRNPMFGQL